MRIIPLPKSVTSYCRLCGTRDGLSIITGGDAAKRSLILKGHMKRAMLDGVSTTAIIQQSTPDMDSALIDFRMRTGAAVYCVNNATKGFAPFEGWPSYLFADFICEMANATMIPPSLHASADLAFQRAEQLNGPKLEVLRSSIPNIAASDKNIILNILDRTQRAMSSILPDEETPEEQKFNFYPVGPEATLRIFHLDAIANRDYDLILTYLKAELRSHREKTWVCDLANYSVLQSFMDAKIKAGNLGLCSQDASLIMSAWASELHREPKISHAAILFQGNRPVNAADIDLLGEPDLTMQDIHWPCKVIYYHGRIGLFADARIWASPFLYE